MSQSDSDSPTSSVESSPNVPRRFLPIHILRTLSPSKQVLPTVSDSESDDESVPVPASYYTSPSRPEKRRHLSVPSPKMAQLSIQGTAQRFKPSIPGYGEGTKKLVRASANMLNRSGSTSQSQDAYRTRGMRGGIPVSELVLKNPSLQSRESLGKF